MNTYALLYFDIEQKEVLKREIVRSFTSFKEYRDDLFIIDGGEETENILKLSFQLLKNIFTSNAKDSLKFFIYSSSEFPDSHMLDSLLAIMKEYDSRLSLNHTSFARLCNPNNFNYRFLGLFQSEMNSESLSIFDFLEDLENSFTKDKIDSKAVFEDSVFNFYNNRIAQAIAGFHNVLQLCPEDKASMKYIERGNDLLSK